MGKGGRGGEGGSVPAMARAATHLVVEVVARHLLWMPKRRRAEEVVGQLQRAVPRAAAPRRLATPSAVRAGRGEGGGGCDYPGASK